MDQPQSRFDQRFSAPDAQATPWTSAQQVLDDAQLSWLTTVRADGRPHVTPLVAVWLDGAVHFSTGADEQKALNLRANSNVVLTTGSSSWSDGIDVVVEGEARRVTDRPMLERLAAAWRAKWDGDFWKFEATDDGFRHEAGEALVYAVEPTKVFAFGKSPFSQTRHTPG